jgi:hypothetical protein
MVEWLPSVLYPGGGGFRGVPFYANEPPAKRVFARSKLNLATL